MSAFERARELAEGLNEYSLLVPALFGLWANRYVSGMPTANLADRFAELTTSSGDSGSRCVALRMLALERFHQAHYKSSLELSEQALAAYEPTAHRDLALRYHRPPIGSDELQGLEPLASRIPDKARAAAEQSLNWAREISHQNTIGIALCFGVTLTNIWLRDVDRVEASTTKSLRMSTQMSLALWKAWAQIHSGWALGERSRREAATRLRPGW